MTRAERGDRRPASESGFLLVGQLLLAFFSVVYPQLGAREGVSSILPPIRLQLDAIGPELDTQEQHAAGDERQRRPISVAPRHQPAPERLVTAPRTIRPTLATGAPTPGHSEGTPTRGPPSVL